MKKTFPFEDPRHKPPRVVEGIKDDVRKYLKRERRKKLPKGADFWDFKCRTGKDIESAEETHVDDITTAIDRGPKEGWPAIYIEVLATPGHRTAKMQKKPSSPESKT